jgi:hypothetical protein
MEQRNNRRLYACLILIVSNRVVQPLSKFDRVLEVITKLDWLLRLKEQHQFECFLH